MRNKLNTPVQTDIVENITTETLPDALDRNYMRYSFAVMEDRALPDAKDGLKPSQRRLLIAMSDLNLSSKSRTVKCAKVCGDTSGNYHPHGEAVIYPTLVRLVQEWNMRYPLVRAQGNFGARDGDKPAAMRYTEAALTVAGDALLEDLSPSVVPYVLNYDESRTEPTVLPAVLPNLIINGCSGIAVGVATRMAPHNLVETVNLIKAYIDNPNLTTDEMIAIMPGPDFPVPCKMLGQQGVRNYYETGRGKIEIEGVYEVKSGDKNTQIIEITELPFGSTAAGFSLEVVALMKDKKIEGISDIMDLSSEDNGIRVIIELSRGTNAQLIIKQLLKSTSLRTSFDVNQTVLIDGEVVENTPMLKLVETFVNHRKVVLTKKFTTEKDKSVARIHILDGLLSVLKDIDKAISIIRETSTEDESIAELIRVGLVQTAIQAKAVLELKLGNLRKLEVGKINKEKSDLELRVNWLTETLANDRKIMREIAKEQDSLAKKIGDERRTIVAPSANDITGEDLIPHRQIIVSLTKDGYIKQLSDDTYRIQARGGRGVSAGVKKETDEAGKVFVTDTHDFVLFFTNLGFMYRKKAYEIPEGSRTSKGTHLANLLALNQEEYVTSTLCVNSLDIEGYLIMVTNDGLIKKSQIRDYNTTFKTRGLQAIKLNEGDRLSFVEETNGNKDVFIVTTNGKAIRYPEETIKVSGRVTSGCKALKLQDGAKIAQLLTIDQNSNPDILVVTEKGFGKKSNANLYRVGVGRNAQGVSTINTKSDRNGEIIGACAVEDDDNFLVITKQGQVIVQPVKDIRAVGKVALGVKIIRLDDKDSVIAIAKIKIDNKDEQETPSL